MKTLKYLKYIQQYSDHAYAALRNNFPDRVSFDSLLNSIESDTEKDLFLRLASFYRFLVKEGNMHYSNPAWCNGLQYIDDTFKFISIFALIEAACSDVKHMDFYEFLVRRDTHLEYPIQSKQHVDKFYEEYKQKHGSIQKAVRFFELLDEKCKRNLVNKLKVKLKASESKSAAWSRWEDKSAIELAKLLYDMRSQFVHNAEFVLTLSKRPVLTLTPKHALLTYLCLEDMMVFFEHGLLLRFGYRGDLNHLLD